MTPDTAAPRPGTEVPLTRLPVGARVRHGDGAGGFVARVVASTNGMPLNLIAWDDMSLTRGGDDVWLVVR